MAILYGQLLVMALSLPLLEGTWGAPSLRGEALKLEQAFVSDGYIKRPWGVPFLLTSIS